jgi:U32 family peptidase
MTTPPELISPAGDWDSAKAAVENGADAIYFGLQAGFNARARAANFGEAQLAELMAHLRLRGVKGYLTLNTLVFPDELAEFERLVRVAVRSGVDAIIVQDPGAARLARAICPALPLHASTQMTLANAECIEAAARLGIERVVLPRELSIAEIAAIRQKTNVSLEVFIHGAMCVSFSGQCLASRSLGGSTSANARSANRGNCAQPCRLEYELIDCGQHEDDSPESGRARNEVIRRGCLLSPLDLAAYELLPELIATGVNALKIEGRMKSAQYVANVTRHYRQAIDAAVAGRPIALSPEAMAEMQVTFSRGFTRGFLKGNPGRALIAKGAPAARGLLLGEVQSVSKNRVLVRLAGPIKRGDGLAFVDPQGISASVGGRVYEIFKAGRSVEAAAASGELELAFGNDKLDLKSVKPRQQVWKTDDPQLDRRLRKTYSGSRAGRRAPLDLVVMGEAGKPLRIAGRAVSGATCDVSSAQSLEPAQRHPLTDQSLRDAFGRLGNTVYQLRDLDFRLQGEVMLPLSVLGAMRREMVRQLDSSLSEPPVRPMADGSALAKLRGDLGGGKHFVKDSFINIRGICEATLPSPPAPLPSCRKRRAEEGSCSYTTANIAGSEKEPDYWTHVLCRDMDRVHGMLARGEKSLIVEFRDVGLYRAAVDAARAADARIALAAPRILKPGEHGALNALAECGADGILVRDLSAMVYFARLKIEVVADFSLNAANELTVHWLRELGAARVTVSADLDWEQLLKLTAAVPPDWLEVVVFRHEPLFHTQYCVFCGECSSSSGKPKCGEPCRRRQLLLRDRMGVAHILKADALCRNTVYNGQPSDATDKMPLLLRRGVRHFRVELLTKEDEHHLPTDGEWPRHLGATEK